MSISNCRVLQLADGSQWCKHIFDGHLKSVETIPASHLFVQTSDILEIWLIIDSIDFLLELAFYLNKAKMEEICISNLNKLLYL